MTFVDGSPLLVRAGMTGATASVYTGLHEFEEMSFALHRLRSHDVFVDAGATVGTCTILAWAVRGARWVAFEPVPDKHDALVMNARVNRVQALMDAQRCALGRTEGSLHFTADLDCSNHVLADGEMHHGAGGNRLRA